MKLTISTPDEMEALGAALARQLRAGDLIGLNGALGAGKTTLVRGLGAALGVSGTITSPTFVLARTHPRGTDAPLVHVDAYRLSSPAELDDLDLDYEGSIVVVEWAAGMLDGVTDSRLDVDIERPAGGRNAEPRDAEPRDADPREAEPRDADDSDAEPREVTITGRGPRFENFRL